MKKMIALMIFMFSYNSRNEINLQLLIQPGNEYELMTLLIRIK